MEANEIVKFIQDTLDQSDIDTLNHINKIKDLELRRVSLRNLFHKENIFNKIKTTVDPTWLCSEIFIKGSLYEF